MSGCVWLLMCVAAAMTASAEASGSRSAAEPVLLQSLEVEKVWSGHPVGFFLLTHEDRQYIAFYDAERRMTVAARRLAEDR